MVQFYLSNIAEQRKEPWTNTDVNKEGSGGLAENKSCETKLICFCKRSSLVPVKLLIQSNVTLL